MDPEATAAMIEKTESFGHQGSDNNSSDSEGENEGKAHRSLSNIRAELTKQGSLKLNGLESDSTPRGM